MRACDLSIIIVSWNVWDLLRASLRAIERSSRPTRNEALRAFGPDDEARTMEVIVVDNASRDATVSALPERFPWVHLIANDTNLGFTAGNNVGYAAAHGRFIYFLNPDTELVNDRRHGDSLWQLFHVIEEADDVAMVGPQLRYADNELQSSRRRFPTRLTGFFESTWLGRLWPNNPWSRRLHMVDWPADLPQDVDWLVGAAMLARRTALEAVRQPDYAGPFDEAYFMYSEELDLCRRLKTAGWRILYLPGPVVIHYEGRSSEQVVAARHIHFNASKVLYYRTYFGRGWADVLRHYLLLEFRMQLWLERVKFLLGHRRSLRRARMDAYRQVLASRLLTRPAVRS